MSKTPRKKVALDRKTLILQAANRLFNHYGVEKTTMEDIARESGIPRATIYLEFNGGKENILLASTKSYMHNALSEMQALARQSRNGRLETLRKVILYYLLAAHDCSTGAQCDPNHVERHTKRIRAEMTEYFQARTRFFQEILEQAALTGEIPENLDSARLAAMVAHGLNCFLPPLNLRMSRVELERDANAFFSLLLSGVAKYPATNPE